MTYDPALHHRRSTRLPAYDYAQAGAYFVTVVAHGRQFLFGEIVDGEMRLSPLGVVAHEEWIRSAEVRGEIELDAFVIMPNHVHGVVMIRDVGAHGRAPLPRSPLRRPARSLGSFVAGFKSVGTRRMNAVRGTPGLPVWQRNYYERIVRHDEELNRVRQYIMDNPLRWEEDPENPSAAGSGAPVPERC